MIKISWTRFYFVARSDGIINVMLDSFWIKSEIIIYCEIINDDRIFEGWVL